MQMELRRHARRIAYIQFTCHQFDVVSKNRMQHFFITNFNCFVSFYTQSKKKIVAFEQLA